MTRRESAADRANQREVAAVLAEVWQCEMVEFKETSLVDYMAVKDATAWALVEIKCRSITYRDRPQYMLSADKWVNTQTVASVLRVRGLLVVRFGDGSIYGTDLLATDPEPPEMRMGGRRDRGDPRDLEPCVWLPISAFRLVRA